MDQRQRPRSVVVPQLEKNEYQEDNVYHYAQMGRVTCEMVRPFVKGHVAGVPYGGYDYATGERTKTHASGHFPVMICVLSVHGQEATYSIHSAEHSDQDCPSPLHDALLP